MVRQGGCQRGGPAPAVGDAGRGVAGSSAETRAAGAGDRGWSAGNGLGRHPPYPPQERPLCGPQTSVAGAGTDGSAACRRTWTSPCWTPTGSRRRPPGIRAVSRRDRGKATAPRLWSGAGSRG
jgi:hypothetical protein